MLTDSKQKVKLIIVNFKSWGSRIAFCKAQPRILWMARRNQAQRVFSVSLDITKRGYVLLTKA